MSERGGWWVVAQAALLGALIALLFTSTVGVGLPTGPALTARIAGTVMLAMGVVQGWLGVRDLGSNLTPFPEPLAQARLIDTGIYGRVRHPLYGAVILSSMGISLFAGNLAAFGVALLIAGFFYAKSHYEEERLVAFFPDYPTYRSRVRKRLIPWVL